MMSGAGTTTAEISRTIEQLRSGDESARDRLIAVGCDRLRMIAHRMLDRFPKLRQWEETDDILQGASMRLYRTLGDIRPDSIRDFYRLATLNIRRELLDLVKHYRRAPVQASARQKEGTTSPNSPVWEDPSNTDEPTKLAAWGEFHETIETMPEEERELFDLLWYQGLTQPDAAELLGVSVRTVKRRWQQARQHLYDKLKGNLPEP